MPCVGFGNDIASLFYSATAHVFSVIPLSQKMFFNLYQSKSIQSVCIYKNIFICSLKVCISAINYTVAVFTLLISIFLVSFSRRANGKVDNFLLLTTEIYILTKTAFV